VQTLTRRKKVGQEVEVGEEAEEGRLLLPLLREGGDAD